MGTICEGLTFFLCIAGGVGLAHWNGCGEVGVTVAFVASALIANFGMQNARSKDRR